MSTENNPQVEQQQEPVLVLDDKKRNINIFDALGDDRFKNYKKTKSSKVTYPKYANLNGIQGRQILSFTIEASIVKLRI